MTSMLPSAVRESWWRLILELFFLCNLVVSKSASRELSLSKTC